MADISNHASASAAFGDWRDGFISRGSFAPRRPFAPVWRHRAERAQSGLPCRFDGSWAVVKTPSAGQARTLHAKRIVDIALALLALLILLPLLVGTAVAVKLTSKGPVFFRQQRPGLYGRSFAMLKFRTMFVESEDTSGVRQTLANDSRVTPLGRFLRAKSIDELPQLINVLLGDMSIVGPRPHVEGMLAAGRPYEDLVPYYRLRYQMRPGLSGWAQANGLRGPTTDEAVAKARIDHDLAYIQNFSLLLDCKIILMTLRQEFLTGTGV